jgi:hypothetical protein
VEKILEGDLYDLIAEDAIHTKEIIAAKMYPMLAPRFGSHSLTSFYKNGLILKCG